MSDLGNRFVSCLMQFSADSQWSKRLQSVDGTIKWLMRFPDGNEAECVYIPIKRVAPYVFHRRLAAH